MKVALSWLDNIQHSMLIDMALKPLLRKLKY